MLLMLAIFMDSVKLLVIVRLVVVSTLKHLLQINVVVLPTMMTVFVSLLCRPTMLCMRFDTMAKLVMVRTMMMAVVYIVFSSVY